MFDFINKIATSVADLRWKWPIPSLMVDVGAVLILLSSVVF